jgi:MoaA/NifB/PqqE/SkfB family radical SAM enzyme
MYKFSDIKKLHIEMSSLCQASCPMCARNYHGGLTNPKVVERNLTFDLFVKLVDQEFLAQLQSISMCGNFGDPILNSDLIPIIEHIAKINPLIDIHLHTNASARTKSWWEHLARALPKQHLVLFGIDGLEDTHHLYRIGTDFNKIIENAKAFISQGGKARWNFITFKHNEHQLDAARQLSQELGFESFQEKQTSRFIGDPFFEVYDKNGLVTHKLEFPTEQKIAFIDKKTVENYKQVFETCTISCEVEQEKSVYIDAQGYLWPCCFLASVPYQYSKPERLVWNFMNDSYASLNKTLENFGGMSGLSLHNRTIKEIVNSPEWQTVWNKGFEDKSILMCSRVCGKFPDTPISQCRDQFLDLDVF